MSESKRPTFGMSNRFNSGPEVPATPPLAADHAQAREMAERVLADDAVRPPTSDTTRPLYVVNLARAYLALAAASPAEREPEIVTDDACKAFLDAMGGKVLDSRHHWHTDDILLVRKGLAAAFPLYRTPPAAPAVGVTEEREMLTAMSKEIDLYRDLVARLWLTIDVAVLDESGDGIDGSVSDDYRREINALWAGFPDHPSVREHFEPAALRGTEG